MHNTHCRGFPVEANVDPTSDLMRIPIEWLAKPFNPSGCEQERNGFRA
jgi:hypothetical protein